MLTKMHTLALKNYIPPKYPGKTLYFVPQERDVAMVSQNFEEEWHPVFTAGLEIETVPGNHITMNLLPHVQVLAQKLRVHLAQAQGQI